MDASKESPFVPASELPLHRNAPLAPSQELAYRKKCIQLKRRLTEIEANNDATRKRIAQEKEHVQKMRLLRAILLNHLKTIMETPGKKLTPEQLEKIGVMANGKGHEAELATTELTNELIRARPDGEVMIDDSSEESDEDEPEPQERPERRRRTNNYRETIMTTTTPNHSATTSLYPQAALPSLAPASSFSPAAPRDPAMLTSSFRVSPSTPFQAATPPQPSYPVQPQQFPVEPSYGQHSSPTAASQHLGLSYQAPVAGPALAPGLGQKTVETNGLPHPAVPSRPERPAEPFVQFTAHMRPQLEADNYPPEQIQPRIQTEWDNLSAENRSLWDERYHEQMREYTAQMDVYKKATRREGAASRGFSAVNS